MLPLSGPRLHYLHIVLMRARGRVCMPKLTMACSSLNSLLLALCVAVCCALPAQHFEKVTPARAYNSTSPPAGTYGVDISSYLSVGDFSCLKNEGFDFAIIRAYQSVGQVDPNAVTNIANARAAGIAYVDVYMFPCPQCGNPSGQVKDMVNALSRSNYGQIWLDIEGSQYWLGSYSANQEFFEGLLQTAKAYKVTGVYASEYEWSSIMGSDYTGGSSAQLWYPHYDDDPSFSDFVPFGGWNRPAIKQYEGDATVCGVDIDKDWY